MSTPFTHEHKPTTVLQPVRERVLARFEKGDHIAEIREREITMFAALEWLTYVDGSLIESRMYHGERLKEYGVELLARRGYFHRGRLDGRRCRVQAAISSYVILAPAELASAGDRADLEALFARLERRAIN